MPKLTQQARATVTAKTEHIIELTPQQTLTVRGNMKTYFTKKEQRDKLDEEMGTNRANVEEVLEEVGEASLTLDTGKASIVAPVRKKVDMTKLTKLLIAKGVKSSVIAEAIAKATKETPGKPYVKFTAPGQAEEEE